MCAHGFQQLTIEGTAAALAAQPGALLNELQLLSQGIGRHRQLDEARDFGSERDVVVWMVCGGWRAGTELGVVQGDGEPQTGCVGAFEKLERDGRFGRRRAGSWGCSVGLRDDGAVGVPVVNFESAQRWDAVKEKGEDEDAAHQQRQVMRDLKLRVSMLKVSKPGSERET